MKIALQFAMPSELHALPGARELAPLETVSGVPIFEIARTFWPVPAASAR